MASTYPTVLDSFSTSHADNVGEVVHAASVNDNADAINKIEAELGTLPKGGAADVKTRIANTETVANAAIPKSTVTTAGDTIYATGNAAVTRLGIGGANTLLHGGASAPSWSGVAIADHTASGTPSATTYLRGDNTWATLPAAGNWTLIADSGTVASQASFDTNTILGGNIASTYKHLRLLFAARTDSTTGILKLQVNNDTGSNYRSAVSAWALSNLAAATTYMDVGAGSAWCHSGSPGEFAGALELTFFDYAQATYKKRVAGNVMTIQNATQSYGGAMESVWTSTAAINRIAVSLTAGNLTEARFTLYGLS